MNQQLKVCISYSLFVTKNKGMPDTFIHLLFIVNKINECQVSHLKGKMQYYWFQDSNSIFFPFRFVMCTFISKQETSSPKGSTRIKAHLLHLLSSQTGRCIHCREDVRSLWPEVKVIEAGSAPRTFFSCSFLRCSSQHCTLCVSTQCLKVRNLPFPAVLECANR